MYIVEKVVTFKIRDNNSYDCVVSDLKDELIANQFCLTLNDQKEHADKEVKKAKDELEALRCQASNTKTY